MSESSSKYLITKLTLTVVAMFAFGFALVPLYDVFCKVTGINGKTSNQVYQPSTATIDTSRVIKVQFITHRNDKMNWLFRPQQKILKVHPGESVMTTFYAKNPNTVNMVAQAIPSVSPGRAAGYFHKTACFCFERQPLMAGEETDMPLVFIVDRDLPRDINTITLAYTLFDVTEKITTASVNQEPTILE